MLSIIHCYGLKAKPSGASERGTKNEIIFYILGVGHRIMYAITRYASHHPCTSRCIKIINFLILILYIKSIKERHLSLRAFSSHLIRAALRCTIFTAHSRYYIAWHNGPLDRCFQCVRERLLSSTFRCNLICRFCFFFFALFCQLTRQSVLMHVVSKHAPFHTRRYIICVHWILTAAMHRYLNQNLNSLSLVNRFTVMNWEVNQKVKMAHSYNFWRIFSFAQKGIGVGNFEAKKGPCLGDW